MFPPVFLDFLKENEISPEIYTISLPKFIGINKKFPITKQVLEVEYGSLEETCIPNFFKLTQECSISNSVNFREGLLKLIIGKVFSMELTSALAIELLELEEDDDFLDLCCAPGTKLCLAASKIGNNGSVTGVDISRVRLSTAQSQVKKYKLQRIRLFNANSMEFDGRVYRIDESLRIKRSKSEKPFFQTTDYRKYPGLQTDELFTKVLVDAECTHDGSIKHVQKQIQNNWKDFDLQLFSKDRLEQLYRSQYEILEAGFRLLKPGGILIYSTCSLTKRQNEQNIQKFLDMHRNCKLIKISLDGFSNEEGFIRIDPMKMKMGALFIAKMTKIKE